MVIEQLIDQQTNSSSSQQDFSKEVQSISKAITNWQWNLENFGGGPVEENSV